MHASHGEPARDRFVDGLLRERLPRGAVHHRGRDLVRRDQRVERRRARLRAIRFVEPAVIDGTAAVAHMHERGLRQRGQQLVRRVRREHRRPVLRMVRRVAAHGEPPFVQRIEARVAVPRLVEMHAIDALREPLFYTDRVVAHAVVRAVREHRVDGALLAGRFRERVVRNALRDRLRLEPLRRNRADDSVAITGRAQKDRDAAGQREALLDRLVAIAVAERDLVVADARGHDGAVRRGRAVQHGVRAVGAEHARGVALARTDRARVAEHRPERAALDAHVGAKQVLAVELEERAADRRLQKRNAPLMARRGPGVLALAVVARQRCGKRRQQVLDVTLDRVLHAPADEPRGVVEHPDELVDELRDLDAHGAREVAAGHEENRHARVARSHGAQQLGRLLVRAGVVVALRPVQQDAVNARIGCDDGAAVVARECFDDLDLPGVELRNQRTDAASSRAARFCEPAVHDERSPDHSPASRTLHHFAFTKGVSRI